MMLDRISTELVEFIVEKTGIKKETVIRVLKAEEAFFEREIEKALTRKLSSTGENGGFSP